MGLLKKLLIGVVVLVVAVVGVGFFLPSTAHVERSTTIDAKPATVFTVLNGFRQFERWSPWADADPDMKITFEGPAMGVGARHSWVGNDQVGTGSQEIIESTPWRHIKVRLVFGDFGGDFTATYTLEPDGNGTRMTWAFDGDYGANIMGRYFGLLANTMVGPDYEKGLQKLKLFAESLPKHDFSSLQVEAVEAAPKPLVFVSSRSAPEPRSLGVALGVAYGRVSGHLSTFDVEPTGAPIVIYHGITEGLLHFDAGLPVSVDSIADDGDIRTGYTPAGKALRVVYTGSQGGLESINRQIRSYLAAAGLKRNGPSWEQYMDEFTDVPDAERTTHIYYGVK